MALQSSVMALGLAQQCSPLIDQTEALQLFFLYRSRTRTVGRTVGQYSEQSCEKPRNGVAGSRGED